MIGLDKAEIHNEDKFILDFKQSLMYHIILLVKLSSLMSNQLKNSKTNLLSRFLLKNFKQLSILKLVKNYQF